jgi:hypothetical protein
MKGKGGEGRNMRGGGLRRRDYHSTGNFFWGVLLDCREES